MENHNKNIDNLFKEGLGSYSEIPPSAVWDALEKRLDKNTKKRRFIYFWYLPVGIFCCIALISVAYILKPANNTEVIALNVASVNNITAPIESTINHPAIENTINNTTPIQQHRKITPHHINSVKSDNQIKQEPVTNQTDKIEQNKVEEDIVAVAAHNVPAPIRQAVQPKAITNKTTENDMSNAVSAKTENTTPISKLLSGTLHTLDNQPKFSDEGKSIKAVTPNVLEASSQPVASNNEAVNHVQPIVPKTIEKTEDKTIIPEPENIFHKYEAGIKVGYEAGMNNDAATKEVVAPYLQYNLTSKLSLMVQPAIKASNVRYKALQGTQSYYKVNSGGSYAQTDSNYIIIIGTPNDTLIVRNYTYTQTHDSIVKSYTFGGTFIEFELPILLKYSITKKLSVYGGVNINYNKYIPITENTYTSDPISKNGQSAPIVNHIGETPTAPPAIGSVISYSGNAIADYKAPLYAAPQSDIFRLGYMLGISYEFRRKWMLDAMIQQSAYKTNVLGGYNINSALSAFYFRFTLGYKLK